jgi:hypothetical protein
MQALVLNSSNHKGKEFKIRIGRISFNFFKLLTLGVFTLVIMIIIGCELSALRKLTLVELVPSNVIAMLSVNWKKICNDYYLKRMANGEEIEKVLLELGIGNEKVLDVVVFSDGQNPPYGSSGIILNGLINKRIVIERLKTQGWREETYKGYCIYLNPTNYDCVSSLKSDAIIIGTKMGVEAVIDVELNPKEGFSKKVPYDGLVARFGKHGYPISAVIAFPQVFQDMGDVAMELGSSLLDFAGLGPLGEVLGKIGFAQGLGFSVSRSGNLFPVELVALMKDESSAKFISGSLNLLKGLTTIVPKGNMSQSEKEAMESLQSMSVTREGEILFIKMTMTEKDLMP